MRHSEPDYVVFASKKVSVSGNLGFRNLKSDFYSAYGISAPCPLNVACCHQPHGSNGSAGEITSLASIKWLHINAYSLRLDMSHAREVTVAVAGLEGCKDEDMTSLKVF